MITGDRKWLLVFKGRVLKNNLRHCLLIFFHFLFLKPFPNWQDWDIQMNSCHCSLFIEKKVQKFPTEIFSMHVFPWKMSVIDLADASGREDYEFEWWLVNHWLFVLRTESSPTSMCVEVLRKNGSGTNFPEHPFFKRVSPFPAADFKSHLDPGLPGLMDAHLIANDYKWLQI